MRSTFLGKLVVLRHGAQRLELRGKQRLVDLALVDRDRFLHANLDHLLPIDPKLLRQLLGRQVVRHLGLPRGSTKKPASRSRGDGLSEPLRLSCRQESKFPPSQVIHHVEE